MNSNISDISNTFIQKKQMKLLDGIHSYDSFRYILERERSRTERNGDIFSLVIFGYNEEKGSNDAFLEQLGAVLVRKVRISDEIGWHEEGKSIGVILPGTAAKGAWQFIEIIKKKMGELKSILVCTVYTYPTPNISNSRNEDPEKKDTLLNHMFPSKTKEKSYPIPPLDGKFVKPMDVLFACPIPSWKRMIDVLVSILLLIFLSPLFLLIALYIKIVSHGPVFYRQERIGYLGRKFKFWKFRTMHMNTDENIHYKYINRVIEKDSPIGKLDDLGDDRIIPMGSFLRKSCLDELPQLWNVLLGDMSLIGPRPCLDYEANKLLPWQNRRFNILPGMSGLWQVSGKNRTTFKEMTRLDIRYSQRLSLGLDIKILFLTLPAILGMVFDSFAKRLTGDQKSSTLVSSRRDLSLHR